MKKKTIFAGAFFALALALASCNKEEIRPDNAASEITKTDSAFKPPKEPVW